MRRPSGELSKEVIQPSCRAPTIGEGPIGTLLIQNSFRYRFRPEWLADRRKSAGWASMSACF